MTVWARLTWQSADPAALATELERRLGIASRGGGMVAGARLLDLGNAVLEVRPWVSEGPDDRPRRAGRLLLEPVGGGEPSPIAAADAPWVLVGLGWATVELERAAMDLDPWLGARAPDDDAVADPHLGARVSRYAGGGLPGAWTVLLEPSTEGRTAASLARDGEGPCALYLRPAGGLAGWMRGRRSAEGPFGRQVLLPDLASGPSTGPFLIVTEGHELVAAAAPPGTIAP